MMTTAHIQKNRYYLQDFDPPRRTVLHADVQAVAEDRIPQQAMQQAVLQQTGLLLDKDLLQLRLEVSVQLQATQQTQQAQQAGRRCLLAGRRTHQVAG